MRQYLPSLMPLCRMYSTLNASLSGLGAVLNQEHPEGLRPNRLCEQKVEYFWAALPHTPVRIPGIEVGCRR